MLTVINALMEQLKVPGTTATLNLMSETEKKAAIEAQIEHFSQTPTSFWYRVSPFEILAPPIWRCRGYVLRERVIRHKFYDVAREEDLARPVARWLQNQGGELTWRFNWADAGLTFSAMPSAGRD